MTARLLLVLASVVCLQAVPVSAQIPNHKDVVTAARKVYASLPPGRLRAYCVVNHTAFALRAEGAGTFYKTGPNSFAERSSDIVMYTPGRETFDVLGDAENTAVPQWGRTSPTGFGNAANWRAPLDPTTVTVCQTQVPPVPPDPEPVPPQPPDLTARVAALEAAVATQSTQIAAQATQIAAMDARLTALDARVAVLEQAPAPAPPCTPHEVTTSRDGGGWYGPGHSHQVTMCVPRGQ